MSKKTKGTVCGMEKPQHGGSKILNQKNTQNLRGSTPPLQLKASLHLNLH